MKIHKNFLTTIALWCTLLGMIWCLGTPQVSAQMTITDPQLAAGIRAQLGISGNSNAFSAQNVTDLTFLSVDGKGKANAARVTDLTGLNAAINLTHLNLANNRIADISALTSLTNLTHLNLANNSLVDTYTPDPNDDGGALTDTPKLAPLASLGNLEVLNLQNNSIININALKSLRALKLLIIQNNNISDFVPLVQNTGLGSGDKVWLGGNTFGVSVPIRISEARFRDPTGLPLDTAAVLRDLQDLYQTGTPPDDFWFFYPGFYDATAQPLMDAGVTLYTTLGEIADIPDRDLRALLKSAIIPFLVTPGWHARLMQAVTEKLQGDLTIRVGDQFLTPDAFNALSPEVTPIGDLVALVRGEPVTIPVLQQIRTLDASADERGYFVTDLTGLEHCTNLEGLLVHGGFLDADSYNNVIGTLTNLKTLGLSNNAELYEDVDDPPILGFLENLTELRTLDLSSNAIVDLSPIFGPPTLRLTKLEALDLRNNDISAIPDTISDYTIPGEMPIPGLTNLRVLYLRNNFLFPTTAHKSQPYLTHSHLYPHNPWLTSALRYLANRPNGLTSDVPIVKNVEFVEPEYAYGPQGLVHIKVTFNSVVGYKAAPGAYKGGKPYLVLSVDGEVAYGSEPAHLAEWLDEGPRDLGIIPAVDDVPAEEVVDLGDTVEFGYYLPPGRTPKKVTVEYLGASPLVYYVPEISITGGPLPRVQRTGDGGTRPLDSPDYTHTAHETYLVTKDWFAGAPRMMRPVIITPPTVQMSRAGGTGTATDDFNVEITFSGPLNAASAAALASKISFGDVAGVSVGSLTRPEPTAYESETWTLSVSVAAGVSGDVTVTLDPEGLRDAADPGNPVAASGSTLSLTVPVDRPAAVPETVEGTDVLTVGSSLEFPISFAEDGVTYEGTAKPYITIYVGERVAANERNAVWARAEDVNSTLVTFTYEIGAGDLASSVSLKTEEGISIPEGTTFVSETLRVEGKDQPASGPGETPRKSSADAAEPVAGNPSLTSVGGATRVSLRGFIAVPTVLEIRQEIVGSVYIPETAEETKTGASSVPRSPIVFNELGNGSGDANDWLEFRNVTGSAVSLKDWELSVVQDGKKEDTSLIVFADVSVPANGLLLVVNTSPDKSSLAAGDDIAGSGKNGGLTHLYLVNSGLSLPDDGKFLLILRNAKEKLGKDEAFVDVAGGGGSGTDAFVREQSGSYDTHVWPLQVREAPGGDTEDALGSGKVWQRAKADIVGYHKDAWAPAAFTGLGYDRKVTKSDAYAGTPGYPNGAVKTEASTPKGSITISEVMFDSGGGKLPQWVELYNKSKTEAINLNRWKLELQNVASGDLVGRPIVTLTLGEKVIQPNQTLLIVAGPARASSGSLPADRVYDLLALHAKNLRIKKPQDTFLSAIGFYLKLSDANGTKIDEVGNTDGNRRTNEVPAWALPVSLEEGVRSSLIRRYTKGTSTAEDGMERGSWVLAANIRRFVAGSEAFHWGHADDIGTPGYRGGGPLPVELSSFAVKRAEAGAVVVTWTTESEVDNAGFNLRRSEKRDSGWTLLNPALIAGAGTTGERQAYTFTDTSAKPGVEYYYQIEEVAFDGRPVTLVTRFLPGPVSASNRMLTTFGGMKKAK